MHPCAIVVLISSIIPTPSSPSRTSRLLSQQQCFLVMLRIINPSCWFGAITTHEVPTQQELASTCRYNHSWYLCDCFKLVWFCCFHCQSHPYQYYAYTDSFPSFEQLTLIAGYRCSTWYLCLEVGMAWYGWSTLVMEVPYGSILGLAGVDSNSSPATGPPLVSWLHTRNRWKHPS